MLDYNASVHSAQAATADKASLGLARRRKESVPDAVIQLTTSFNNTLITVRKGGDTLGSSSAGACDFRGAKKSTTFAARVAFEKAIEKACDKYRAKYKHDLGCVEVRIKGPGQGSEQALIALKNKDIVVTRIINITGIPHNGCRPRKRRRV